MFVAIAGDMSAARVSVDDADDCTRLHVTVDGLDDAAAGDVLRQHRPGRPGAPGQVWLDLRALRERAREIPKATDWEHRFDLMVAYARREGWLDPSGKLVSAHISRRTL
jgi:hypothetical protein